MIKRFKCDKIVTLSGIISGYVYTVDEKISYVGSDELPFDEEILLVGKYLLPGFVELHTHGAGGNPFLTKDKNVVKMACDHHLRHGTTTILPTLSASPIEVIEESVMAIKEARDEGLTLANIIGAHIEGPYLAPEMCGAQCTDYITPPIKEDYSGLVSRLGDAIARWTYAPEFDSGEFAKYLTENNILPSAGHSAAKYQDIVRAMEGGCNLVTHLYSCTSTVTRSGGFRSLGIIESTFLLDDMYAELIADGKHLPCELVKMIIKIKGIDRVILCTDSLEIAGTDIKEGVMAGTSFIVEDGVCKLRDRSAFAGSVATSDVLLRFIVNECGYSITDAAKMLSYNPARLIKTPRGAIAEGLYCDLVALDEDLRVCDVFVGGKRV